MVYVSSFMIRAFTFIELLIVISVFLIIAGVVVFNPIRGPETYELINAAQEIGATLRRAQGLGIAVQDFKGSPPSGGWGVHFDENENCYIIFADENNNGRYNPGEEASGVCDAGVIAANSERLERVFLPSSITVFQVSRDGNPEADGDLDIVFIPPLLNVEFDANAGCSPCQEAEIIVRSTTLTTTKTITVNAVGNVEVQ